MSVVFVFICSPDVVLCFEDVSVPVLAVSTSDGEGFYLYRNENPLLYVVVARHKRASSKEGIRKIKYKNFLLSFWSLVCHQFG